MSEDNQRSTSFAEAGAKLKMGAIESLSSISDWADAYQDELKAAGEAAKEETEDKGFYGWLATLGTAAACLGYGYVTGGLGLGACAAAGTIAGVGTRYGIDKFGEAEEQVPGKAEEVATKFYGSKVDEIAEDLNESRQLLEDFHANEWKQDVLLQMQDSWSAFKLESGIHKLGWDKPAEGIADEIASDTVSESIFEPVLIDPMYDDQLLDMEEIFNVPGWRR
jgi:hypothetical protein